MLAAITPTRLMIDMRNVWDRVQWQAEGFRLFRLGDGLQTFEN
jgi:hypothetical protein